MKSPNRISFLGMLLFAAATAGNFGCNGAQSMRLPISVAVSATATAMDQNQTVTLTATVVNDSEAKGVTWSLAGTGCTGAACGTLSNQTATSATYIATTGVGAELSVNVTATSVADTTKSSSQPLTVFLPPRIMTTSLQNATGGAAYSQTLQESGGVSPFTWSLTSGSSLPAGLNLNSDGAITGTPTAGGVFNFTVQVTDSANPPVSYFQGLLITVLGGTGANDSELSGHYAFLFNGFDDATGSQAAIAGSFTADGKGAIAAGIEDENGHAGPTLNLPFTGTYSIDADNRGVFSITTPSGTETYVFVLNSISSGVAQRARLVEFDDTTGTNGTRGSGVMRLQDTTAFTLASVTGPYAFGFAGQDASGARSAIVGSFMADGSGNIPSGTADQNVAGAAANPSLAGTYTAPSVSNGRGTMTLSPSGASSLDLSVYVVSANELLVMTTDNFLSDGIVSGTMLSQTSTSFSTNSLNAPSVYYEAGNSSPFGFAEIALFSPDGSGNLTVTYDRQNGTVIAANNTFTTTYSVSSDGRVTVPDYYGDTTSPLRILYLVDVNKAFFFDTGGAVGLGFLEPQAAPAGGFSNTSFSGTFSANTIAPSATADFNASGVATLDGTGNFSESVDLSAIFGLFGNQTTTGSCSVGANGRGTVTSLRITTATVGGGPLLIFLLLASFALLISSPSISRRSPSRSRPAWVMFLLVALVVSMAPSCPRPPPSTNEFVFYIISPTKAVTIHEMSNNGTPGITILEQ